MNLYYANWNFKSIPREVITHTTVYVVFKRNIQQSFKKKKIHFPSIYSRVAALKIYLCTNIQRHSIKHNTCLFTITFQLQNLQSIYIYIQRMRKVTIGIFVNSPTLLLTLYTILLQGKNRHIKQH